MSKSRQLIKASEANNVVPVEVDIPDPIIAEEAALQAMEHLGQVTIPTEYVNKLAAVGIHVKGAGVIRIQRGRAMLNQTLLDRCMVDLAKMINKIASGSAKARVDQASKLSHALGYLSSKLTESQRFMAELEGRGVIGTRNSKGQESVDEPPAQLSFVPGSNVSPQQIVTKEVHIHNPPAAVSS